jgi:hypothetical protein
MEESLDYLGNNNDLEDTSLKAWTIKDIIDKVDFIKIQNFCFE